VKLAAVGDIALTHSLNELLIRNSSKYPFENIKGTFNNHDIVIGNLEAPISSRGKTFPLKCSLRTNPEYVDAIKTSGINVVSMANNHILDYGEEAFYDTIEILEKNDIGFNGAGINLYQARKPHIETIKGMVFGFLSYCDVEIQSPFYADLNTCGIAALNLVHIEEDIKKLKNKVDMVIISLHWGIENFRFPTPEQVKIAHKIIELGCDILLGHHPHVLQGYEKYNHGYIFYSLGNFIFPNIEWAWVNKFGKKIRSSVNLTKFNQRSIILSFEIIKKKIKNINFISAQIGDDFITVVDKKDKELLKYMHKLSYPIRYEFYFIFYSLYLTLKKVESILLKYISKARNIHKIKQKLLLLINKNRA